jgi:hypothetical protein
VKLDCLFLIFVLKFICEWLPKTRDLRRREVDGKYARNLARERTVQEDIIREPVELVDEDLDLISGGLDLNIADIDQYIRQVQVYGYRNNQAAVNSSSVSQSA